MRRLTFLAAAAILVVTALPASAQYGGGAPVVVPPAQEAGQVQVTTPCSTVIITGNSWEPGTEVFIDRNFSQADCPGTGNPPDVRQDIPEEANGPAADEDGGNFAEQSDESVAAGSAESVAVAEDGTFIAEVLVPADAVDRFEVTVRGTDLTGEAKNQGYVFDVQPAASFVPTADTADDNTTTIAFIALLAAAVLAIGFNLPRLASRRRR